MDLSSAVNLAASLVTIIGTTLTITQAFIHKPSAFRQDGGAPPPPRYPPPAAWHAPAPQMAPPSAVRARRSVARTGIGYGLGLGIAVSVVVLTGTWLLDVIGWGQSRFDAPTQQQTLLALLMLAAIASLFIAAGLAPARRVGSVMSGLLAGAIVAAAFDISTAAVTTQTSPWTTFVDNLGDGLVPSLIGFALSAICALLGYWAYHRTSSRRETPVPSSMS